MMKRILLNTALAAVLYLSNTTYASDDHRDDLTIRSTQSLTGQALFSTLLNELPEEMITHILSFSKLKDLGRFSQASRDGQRLAHEPISIKMSKLDKISEYANPHVERPLSSQFTHLLEAILDGSAEFKKYEFYPATRTTGSSNDELKVKLWAVDNNECLILKDDDKASSSLITHSRTADPVMFYHEAEKKDYCARYSSADGKIYAGYEKDGQRRSFVMTVDRELQNSDLIKNAAGISKPFIYHGKVIRVTIPSFQFLQHPIGIVASRIDNVSLDGQIILGKCDDIKGREWNFVWTHKSGMQKLADIPGSPANNLKSSGTAVFCQTGNGEMIGGNAIAADKWVAGIWVGEQRGFFPMQKMLRFGPKPIEENAVLERIGMMSLDGKLMLGEGCLVEENSQKGFWWTFNSHSKENQSLNNDSTSLLIN